MRMRTELHIYDARVKSFCCKGLLDLSNLWSSRQLKTIDHRVWRCDGNRWSLAVSDPRDEDAGVPAPVGERGFNDTIGRCMRLDSPSSTVGQRKMPRCSKFRDAQHRRSGRPRRLFQRDDLPQVPAVTSPVTSKGI